MALITKSIGTLISNKKKMRTEAVTNNNASASTSFKGKGRQERPRK